MKLFIVPVPILNRDMEVVAYMFRYQAADRPMISGQSSYSFDGTIDSPVIEILNQVGLHAFTNGKPIFVPISNVALLTDLENQCQAPADKVVFTLDKTVSSDDLVLSRIKHFKEKGYQFAIQDINNHNIGSFGAILPEIAYLLVESQHLEPRILQLVKNNNPKLKFIACDVESSEIYEELEPTVYDYFEGPFYRLPVTKGLNSVSPLKINSLQLLNLVRDENFDLTELVKTVQKDTALSVSLLKIVNSAHVGMRQKIKSLNQAAAILGQNELRKWVTTAVAKSLGDDRPNELTKLSLTRAKFAENLAGKFEMGTHSDSLYLMGLFSILDALLEVSMEQAFNIIQVSDEIREALVEKQGRFYPIYDYMLKYETANWQGVARINILNGFDAEDSFNAYIDAVKWYSDLISEAETAE